MLYQRKHLADMSAVGEPGPLPADLDGLADGDLANLDWTDAFLGYRGDGFFPDDGVRRITRIGFLQRISLDKRAAIMAADTDPLIRAFLFTLQATDLVELDLAETVAALGYLQSEGFLTAEEVEAVLA